ncbi:MAG: hypothetical protein P1P84_05300 [Deferrisomatales bacterium]|nr:hypothetical protein [Deferrisomatales bacterium]
MSKSKEGSTLPANPEPANSTPGGPDLIADLRLDDFISSVAVAVEIEVKIKDRNPGREEFWMTSERFEVKVAVLNDPLSKKAFVVTPRVRQAVPDEARDVVCTLVVTTRGEHFIWLAKLPAHADDDWGYTRLQALRASKKCWVRLVGDREQGCYRVIEATGDLAQPVWPEESLSTILERTFEDRIIRDLDHEVLRRLRGEVV